MPGEGAVQVTVFCAAYSRTTVHCPVSWWRMANLYSTASSADDPMPVKVTSAPAVGRGRGRRDAHRVHERHVAVVTEASKEGFGRAVAPLLEIDRQRRQNTVWINGDVIDCKTSRVTAARRARMAHVERWCE